MLMTQKNFRAQQAAKDLAAQGLPKAKRGDPFYQEIKTVRVLIGELNRARRDGWSIGQIGELERDLAEARRVLEAARKAAGQHE